MIDLDTSTPYALARQRFQRAQEWDDRDRQQALEDKDFYAGDQWDKQMERDRTNDQRPIFTINLLPKFVRQVTGEGKLNEVAVDVLPVDDKSDPSLAEVYKGLIKTIEHDNNAETIYEDGLSSSAVCGRGGWRLFTEYEHPFSFDQVIKMSPIPEAMAIYFDPACKEYDKSDGEYCFVSEWMPTEEFKRRYGDDATSYSDLGLDDDGTWIKDNQQRMAEYWVKEHQEMPIWLVQTQDGYEVVRSDDIYTKEGLEAEGYVIVDERTTDIVTVKVYEMGGGGFLSREGKPMDTSDKYGKPFPSKYIPIIPVLGPEVRARGEIYYWSVIRWAKTPQGLYNLWSSTAAEKTSLSPKAPWIGTAKNFEGLENIWRDANNVTNAYLPYNVDPEAPTTKPERNFPEPIHQAELALRQSAYDDMLNTTGLTKAALGEEGNEISGKAIWMRQGESDIGTIDWIKNLHRSIQHSGRVMVDMIPKVYNTERAVRMLGEDGTAEFVMLNQVKTMPGTTEQTIVNDMTSGQYNVRVTTGPSFKTAREQAATTFIQLAGAVPMHAHMFLDYIIKNLDIKGADELAKRIAIAMGWEKDPEAPPPPPDINQMKDEAELEGKQLLNAQREIDLATKLKEYQKTLDPQILQDVMQTLAVSAGQPPVGGQPPQGAM